jgi:L-ribulose-5-phosphate 3-epimerase
MRTTRRTFLQATGGAMAAGWVAGQPRVAAAQGSLKKAVLISMLPKQLSVPDKFALAREVGFEGIEVHTIPDPREAETIAAASKASGIPVHCVMNSDHWRYPLSSADPEVVKKSVHGMHTSLRNAALLGAGAVLLVPAVVDAQTPYAEAWTRSHRVIRDEILPLAEQLKVIVGIEEVWNKFLLSPLEMAQYVDEFKSPWVQAYFDVGNIVFYGYPHDWIRTLGKRIVRVHVKDFKLERGQGRFHWKNIGEGDIDWVETRKALADIGYSGFITTEIDGGDRAYLADVSARLDRFFAGKPPVTT